MKAKIKGFPVNVTDGGHTTTEPNYCLDRMNKFERQYGISTEEMLSGNYDIDKWDSLNWQLCYRMVQEGVELNERQY